MVDRGVPIKAALPQDENSNAIQAGGYISFKDKDAANASPLTIDGEKIIKVPDDAITIRMKVQTADIKVGDAASMANGNTVVAADEVAVFPVCNMTIIVVSAVSGTPVLNYNWEHGA